MDIRMENMMALQRDEATSYEVYRRLSQVEKGPANRDVLLRIAADEKRHYALLRTRTGRDVRPARGKVWFYVLLARVLGVTFAMRRMELGEKDAGRLYANYPDMEDFVGMARDEERHEQELIGLIDEERLAYMGSVVLGLNDALVEFTGALAGFTLALGDSRLIALTGSITGIAAALSMASSEYLSTKSDKEPGKRPVKAAIYTGIAYVVTVVALVMPFVLISNALAALGVMLAAALLIIALFNYYYAVARAESFRRRFTEMAVLSFTVAGISFLIGYLLKALTGIEA